MPTPTFRDEPNYSNGGASASGIELVSPSSTTTATTATSTDGGAVGGINSKSGNGGNPRHIKKVVLSDQKDDIDNDIDNDSHSHAHGPSLPLGNATETAQITVNIIISFVGAGLLGIPKAFSRAGWLLGSVALCGVSALNVYAMLLLPKVRTKLVQQRNVTCRSYGTLGRVLLGVHGEFVVNLCLIVSQTGFATAYLIFIAESLQKMRNVARWKVCFGCVPGLALLVQARDMKHLSPFSLLANIANLLGLSAVLVQDVETLEEPQEERAQVDQEIQAIKWGGVLYVMAVTLYSMEGVGLILSLEQSCRDTSTFPGLLRRVVGGITIFMALFGSAGYMAFGDETEAPITLNLGRSAAATLVQGALCVALYFTYPVMMFPVWTIAEEKLLALWPAHGGASSAEYQAAKSDEFEADAKDAMENDTALDDIDGENNGGINMNEFDGDFNSVDNDLHDDDDDDDGRPPRTSASVTAIRHGTAAPAWQGRVLRATVVLTTACVAYAVPDFGEYLSLVGSSICTILGFLLPAYFHLRVFGAELAAWEYALNLFLLVGGSLFAIMGTLQSMSNMAAASAEGDGR